MNKKQWEILEEYPGHFELLRNDIDICFDEIVDDGFAWWLFKGEHVIARLLMRTNEIVNYDDFADRIEGV